MESLPPEQIIPDGNGDTGGLTRCHLLQGTAFHRREMAKGDVYGILSGESPGLGVQ